MKRGSTFLLVCLFVGLLLFIYVCIAIKFIALRSIKLKSDSFGGVL